MDLFAYRDGRLFAEDVAVADIARAVGTPFYAYSATMMRTQYRAFADAFGGTDATVCYAMKANSNRAVVALFAQQGAGADTVSEGEIRLAISAGVPPQKIVFSGVGKTRAEMAAALQFGILQFNVESEPELLALSEIAAVRGATARIAIRINPDVDAATHAKISTGRKENKFGIPWPQARAVFAMAARLPGIRVTGITVHIGSQLTSLAPFEAAFRIVAGAVQTLRDDGIAIDHLDLGGGLGVRYRDGDHPPSPADYAAMVKRVTSNLGCRLFFEPGRLLVADAGILVARLIYLKETEHRRFAIVDAAMNDLIRPTLYDAYHEVVPVKEPDGDAPRRRVDIVGPVCETGDVLALDRPMPELIADDLLAVRSAGAYGAVMASSYNARLLVPEVLVNGADFAVIRPRPTYEDLLSADVIPDWLKAGRSH